MEISDTAVFERPQVGRAWFEAAIRDHLTLGRPDKVRIVFGRQVRSTTPGRFATNVITRGVYPRIEIRYKSSGTKAYFKHEQALRVEATLNNAEDLRLKKTLNAKNWRALRGAGAQVNERFLNALGEGAPGLPDPAALQAVVMPSVHDGQRAPGLRFGDPRVVALLGAVCAFDTVFDGLTNAALRVRMAAVLYDAAYSSAQATYDLRRLRLKGIIERVPGRHRYQVDALTVDGSPPSSPARPPGSSSRRWPTSTRSAGLLDACDIRWPAPGVPSTRSCVLFFATATSLHDLRRGPPRSHTYPPRTARCRARGADSEATCTPFDATDPHNASPP